MLLSPGGFWGAKATFALEPISPTFPARKATRASECRREVGIGKILKKKGGAMNSNQAGQNRDKLILCFPNWTAALAAALEPAAKERYRREILAFLHHCKIHHAGASIILAKAYLSVAETQGRSGAAA
ncbi:MAG: hypothetical protein IPL39_15680 [Opitutaceae bacterium]|nr:hypothetical protein [Opitutaceae bacterium]